MLRPRRWPWRQSSQLHRSPTPKSVGAATEVIEGETGGAAGLAVLAVVSSLAAAVAKVPLRLLGKVGGEAITLDGEPALPLAALKTAHEGWLPRFMAHG